MRPFSIRVSANLPHALPLDYKLRGSKGKYILKKAVEPLLPSGILHRKKKGFGIPIADWLKGRLNPLMHDMLDATPSQDQGLFDPAYVSKLIRNTNRASQVTTNSFGRCLSSSCGTTNFWPYRKIGKE